MKKNSIKVSRRRFVATAAAAGASIPFSGLVSPGFEAIQQPAGSVIHVFTKPMQWLGFEEMSALLAEAGAEGIDLPVRPGGHILPENVEAELPKAVEAARKHGLRMDMIVTGITSAEEKYTESILRTASSLGIKYYRMGWIGYDDSLGIMGTLQKLRPEMKKLESLNRKFKIHGAYQNHSGTRIGGPVWDLYELLKESDPEYLGCQYDIRHAVAEGGVSWVNGLKLIMPWIRCTDIKDFKWSNNNGRWVPETVPLGEGMVNFDDYFKIIRSSKFRGPVSLHLEYPPFERFKGTVPDAEKKKMFVEAMKKDIDKLKAYIAKYQL